MRTLPSWLEGAAWSQSREGTRHQKGQSWRETQPGSAVRESAWGLYTAWLLLSCPKGPKQSQEEMELRGTVRGIDPLTGDRGAHPRKMPCLLSPLGVHCSSEHPDQMPPAGHWAGPPAPTEVSWHLYFPGLLPLAPTGIRWRRGQDGSRREEEGISRLHRQPAPPQTQVERDEQTLSCTLTSEIVPEKRGRC